jgi:uncharacterized protein
LTDNAPAQPRLPAFLDIPGSRYALEVMPPRRIDAPGFDYPFQIDIALPASYRVNPDCHYPVLWLTDGPAMMPLAVGLLGTLALSGKVPESILIGIGHDPAIGFAECAARRAEDFAVPAGEERYFDGPGGDFLRQFTPPARQNADALLAFLVDTLRPTLADEFRMAKRHGLVGHSAGGLFASYALFARTGAFSDFLIGSPAINAENRKVFAMEKSYAADNADLPIGLFLGAGEREMDSPTFAAWGMVSAMALFAETLRVRAYPSLRLATRIFPGRGHSEVISDILLTGLQEIWVEPPVA